MAWSSGKKEDVGFKAASGILSTDPSFKWFGEKYGLSPNQLNSDIWLRVVPSAINETQADGASENTFIDKHTTSSPVMLVREDSNSGGNTQGHNDTLWLARDSSGNRMRNFLNPANHLDNTGAVSAGYTIKLYQDDGNGAIDTSAQITTTDGNWIFYYKEGALVTDTTTTPNDRNWETDGNSTLWAVLYQYVGPTFGVSNDSSISDGKILAYNGTSKTLEWVTQSGGGGSVTVNDSTANTDFPVVFHDESNGLLDDTATFLYNPSTGKLSIKGDFEIESSSPHILLKDATGAENKHAIKFQDDDGSDVFDICTTDGSIPKLVIGSVVANRPLGFQTNNTMRMTITDAGRVGIGRDDPSSILHIETDDEPSLIIEDSSASLSAGDNFAEISFRSNDSNNTLAGDQATIRIIAGVNGADGIMQLCTDTAATEEANKPDPTMTLTEDGKVGIGTTSPSEKLEVGGSIKASGTIGNLVVNSHGQQLEVGSTDVTTLRFDADRWRLYAGESSAADEVLTVLEDGKVGIGTVAPSEKLEVAGIVKIQPTNISAPQTGLILHDLGTGTNEGLNIQWTSASDANTAYAGSVANDSFRIGTGGTERIRINGSGDMGIGTTSPSTKLDVNGTVTATSFAGPLTGNADTATSLSSPDNIAATGDIAWNVNYSGAGDVSGVATIQANAVDSAEIAAGAIDLAHMSANSVDSDQYVDSSIDAAHIAPNQITLAKLAPITRANIIVGDSNGDPSSLAAGTEDQIISIDSNGDIGWRDETDTVYTGGTGISVSGSNVITTTDSDIVHDNLSGFVANEHINHSGITVTAGDGLTGGGTIQYSRTINVVGGNGIVANANDIAIDEKANGGLVIESGELAVDLSASSITGTLAVSDGGTGQTDLANVTVGNATNVTSTIASAVTATTQSDNDNSNKVATTAYVDTAVQGAVASDKVKQAYMMNFYDNVGTGMHYLSWRDQFENTSISGDTQDTEMTAPADGRIVAIMGKFGSIANNFSRTFRVYRQVASYPGIEESVGASVTNVDDYSRYIWYFDEDVHFYAGDGIKISVQDSVDNGGGNVHYLVTVVIEWNYAEMGETTTGKVY